MTLRRLVAISLLAALFVACAPTPTPEPLAARVNGDPITLAEFERQAAQVEAILLAQGGSDVEERMAQARRQVLEQLIELVLVRQASPQLGVVLEEAAVEAALQEAIVEIGGEEALRTHLTEIGLSREQFQQELEQELLFSKVLEALTAPLPTAEEQVHLRQIVVDSPAIAQEVLARYQAGEELSFLATVYSLDAPSRESGGDLGFVPQGVLPTEVEQAAFALKPGQVSQLIQTPMGVYIIQVIARELRELPTEVWEARRLQVYQEWIAQLRAEAAIERYIEE